VESKQLPMCGRAARSPRDIGAVLLISTVVKTATRRMPRPDFVDREEARPVSSELDGGNVAGLAAINARSSWKHR